jgi:hypothetical protein
LYDERVSSGRRSLIVSLAGVLSISVSGCQLVFGLGDYETDPGGSGGEGASNLPGDGGAGAMGGTTTSGPSCECGLDPIWQPVSLVDQGDAAGHDRGPARQAAPITVFVGEARRCSSCTCTASGL